MGCLHGPPRGDPRTARGAAWNGSSLCRRGLPPPPQTPVSLALPDWGHRAEQVIRRLPHTRRPPGFRRAIRALGTSLRDVTRAHRLRARCWRSTPAAHHTPCCHRGGEGSERRCYHQTRDREQAAPRSHSPAARPLEGDPVGAATGALDAGDRRAAGFSRVTVRSYIRANGISGRRNAAAASSSGRGDTDGVAAPLLRCTDNIAARRHCLDQFPSADYTFAS